MMRNWQREMHRDLSAKAVLPCTCENNGDLCPRCDAREYLSSIPVPRGVLDYTPESEVNG